jgi:hypothetical protein
MTAITATIFMLTSLSLAILSKRLNFSSTIGLDKPISSPVAPAAPPGVPSPAQPMTEPHTPHETPPTAPSKP